jgi:lysozyme
LNEGGDKNEVARRLKLYNKAGGKVLTGLVRRRQEEVDIFLNGKYPSGSIPVYDVTTKNKVGKVIKRIGPEQAQKFLSDRANPAPQGGFLSALIKAILALFRRNK